MFWIDDPSLSIGLMVVPQTDTQSTQTGFGSVGPNPNPSSTSAGLANVALAGAVMNSAMSSTTAIGGTGVGYGISRMSTTASAAKRGRKMSSLNEKQSLEDSDQEYQTWENSNDQERDRHDETITTTTTTEEYVQSTAIRSTSEREAGHMSLKME
ncbi:hypothetical protein BGX26_003717 [Mortierella sp. AD094]|nr:hypothetical protein BGX26_003717 [Mortierella sp. AD094]